MITSAMSTYERLSAEYKSLVDDFINMLMFRQENNDETIRVIQDARNGIGLSKGFDNVDDLMEDLYADD